MNNSSDEPSDENNVNKFCNQGVRPKVKNYVYGRENEVLQPQTSVQNGTASQSEKVSSIQNGASCSSSISSSSSPSPPSSSCFLNNLSCDKKNGEHSGEKCSARGRSLSVEDKDSSNQDKKRKIGCFVDNDSSSGNEGEEGLSGDDCCIYTYKGDQFADLPNSFFSVDMVANRANQPLRENHRKANHRRDPQAEEYDRNNSGSSPEMDYLEMDFDPGPSLEQDSEEDINGFDGKLNNDSPVPELPSEQIFIDDQTDDVNNVSVKMEQCQDSQEPQPGPSSENVYQCSGLLSKMSDSSNCNFSSSKEFLGHYCASFCSNDGKHQNCHNSKQGVTEEKYEVAGNDISMISCQLFTGERLDSKILLTEKNDLGISVDINKEADLKIPFDGIMLWTEQEAISKQVSLVSSEGSCAATAVINAMFVLKMRISVEKVKEGISTRLKTESASIPQYLVSRSFAGAAHENLIRGIHHASHGLLYARFFQMYPRRDIVLSRWLFHWMKKGAVPIATMNVQREATSEDSTLDTRHHQMIFGVNSKGIYLTNPLECLQEEELWCRLVSPSVLKIKRSEITSRWSPETNLKPLMCQSDNRWKKMNVLGQVVNIIRESPDSGTQGKFLTQYISIPASSGITLVIPRHSPGYEELVSTADLPLLSPATSE